MNPASKRISIVLILISLCISTMWGQSYEGFLADSSGNQYRIWMDLRIADESVTGSYFYKDKGKAILLRGTSNAGTLRVSELDKKGKESALFTLSSLTDSLHGSWVPSKKSDSYTVVLWRSDSSWRTAAKTPDAYKIFPGFKKEYRHCEYSHSYPLLRSGLASVALDYHNCDDGDGWLRYEEGSIASLVDNSNYKSIHLEQEIDPSRMEDFVTHLVDRSVDATVSSIYELLWEKRYLIESDDLDDSLQSLVYDNGSIVASAVKDVLADNIDSAGLQQLADFVNNPDSITFIDNNLDVQMSALRQQIAIGIRASIANDGADRCTEGVHRFGDYRLSFYGTLWCDPPEMGPWFRCDLTYQELARFLRPKSILLRLAR